MPIVLANDGIDTAGKQILEKEGFSVLTEKVPQVALAEFINANNVEVLIVRSATQVRGDIMDKCPNLKVIGRAGVGMDNIDVAYAKETGKICVNTPDASSQSVAELVFAHFYSLSRQLNRSFLEMPSSGSVDFNKLKKDYSAGVELHGKTIGIIGFGRIGQAVGRIAVGLGMHIKAYDPFIERVDLKLNLFGIGKIAVEVVTGDFESLIRESDYITLHVPHKSGTPALISLETFKKMKRTAIVVNASRGGVVHELDLLEALNQNLIAGAGLDVFDNEPTPMDALLKHPKISCTPHIGASTAEAQERIGIEMARKVVEQFS